MNHVLYMAGIVQLRNDAQGRRYYRRRLADGKTAREPKRCLRRRLSDVVYRQLVQDAMHKAGPGGQSGASTSSSAADLTPVIGSSDQPLPGPADPTLLPPATAGKTSGPGTGAPTRAPEDSTCGAPPDERRRRRQALPHHCEPAGPSLDNRRHRREP